MNTNVFKCFHKNLWTSFPFKRFLKITFLPGSTYKMLRQLKKKLNAFIHKVNKICTACFKELCHPLSDTKKRPILRE